GGCQPGDGPRPRHRRPGWSDLTESHRAVARVAAPGPVEPAGSGRRGPALLARVGRGLVVRPGGLLGDALSHGPRAVEGERSRRGGRGLDNATGVADLAALVGSLGGAMGTGIRFLPD